MWCCSNCGAVYHTDYPRCPFDGGEVVLAATDPLVGQRSGNYDVDQLSGDGGMGRVYAAHHANLASKRYAIKVLLGDVAATTSMRERFTREAEAASRLEHPNIVNVIDYGAMASGLPYHVMDFVDGERLSSMIDDRRMEPARVMRIARAVADGLGYAHAQGVVHRDLKPDNVMIVTTPGGGEIPRIADFGLATTMDPETARLTSTGMAMGTPAYAAPEQMAGRRVDHRADLYALGMTMFEMLTGGTLPFEGHPMETAAAKAHREAARVTEVAKGLVLPAGLEDLVMVLVKRLAAERLDSAAAVIAAIDKIVAGVDERAATVVESMSGRFDGSEARLRRNVPIGWVIAGVVGIAAVAGAWVQRGGEAETQVAAAAPVEPVPPVPATTTTSTSPSPSPSKSTTTTTTTSTPTPDVLEHHDTDARHVTRREPARVHAPTPHATKHVAPQTTTPPTPPPKPEIEATHVETPPPSPPPAVELAAHIAGVSVQGALSQQSVERAVARVAGAIQQCTPAQAQTVRVHFTIDESRRPQRIHAAPANACVAAAIAGVRSEAAPGRRRRRDRRADRLPMKMLAMLLFGCLPGPEVGSLQNSGDASIASTDASPACNADSDPSTPVSYSADLVSGVFQRGHCVMCHTGGGEGTAQSGFDMSSYGSLRKGGQHSGASIVVDDQPCASILYEKVTASPPFGKRMPYDGPPYLSDPDILLVHDWIAEGAHDN